MTRLYITEHGARVAVRGGRIEVSTQGDTKAGAAHMGGVR